MRNTYDKLEGIKYTSVNGNPYWFLSDLKKEFGTNVEITNQVPGHSLRVSTGDVIDYALSLRSVYTIAIYSKNDTLALCLLAYRGFSSDIYTIDFICEHNKRVELREILREREEAFNKHMVYLHISNYNKAIIKSSADNALFGMHTKDIKKRFNISRAEPLYDYLSSIALQARIVAIDNMLKRSSTEVSLKDLYIETNRNEREFLLSYHIDPIQQISDSISNESKTIDIFISNVINGDTSIIIPPFSFQ